MRVVVTGAAGFIGYHTAERLLAAGYAVTGLDNLNAYYDVRLKRARLARLISHPGFTFVKGSIADPGAVRHALEEAKPETVIHLAAQAGVRYSLDHPLEVVRTNVEGFQVILEACRSFRVGHLVFASSSSVYGLNTKLPFAESDNTDRPANPYGASKKANEVMAQAYAHLFRLPCTGLRFFTVYGPWGRPDMAPYRFTENIVRGHPIDVYNQGDHLRDFTYIADAVDGVVLAMERSPALAPAGRKGTPFAVLNIGNGGPVRLMDFIGAIEKAAGRKAAIRFSAQQPGDMHTTFADISMAAKTIAYAPQTSYGEGVSKLVRWYQDEWSTQPH
jgi:UDP-glucuronate 4-epimerase